MNEGQPKSAEDTYSRAEMQGIAGNPVDTIYTRPASNTVPTEPPHPADDTVIHGVELRDEVQKALSLRADPDEASTLGGSAEQTPDSEIG